MIINTVGLQRSGLHGIAYYLLCQHSHFQSKNPPELKHCQDDIYYIESKYKSLFFLFNYAFFNQSLLDVNKVHHLLSAEKTIENTVILFEISRICDYNGQQHRDKRQLDNEEKYLLVMRDLKNTFASHYIKYNTVGNHIINHWRRNAKEWLGETNYLPNKHRLRYNNWVSSQTYRRQKCIELGLTFTDVGINTVPNFGRGSSQDGLKYDGNAQQMNTLKRYEQCMNDSRFTQFLTPELKELDYEIFGEV